MTAAGGECGRRANRGVPGPWRGARPWLAVGAALWALCLPFGTGGALAAGPVPAPPAVEGWSAAILNPATGQVLWSYHGDRRVPMASTTKMMTALVALGLTHDRTGMTMVVPPQVRQAYGEMLGLQPGERFTFQQLLEGMLLYSANDAAIAIAVDTAGSQAAFVRLMNRRAQELGLRNTHYANPDGLDDPDHYSSAIDLARLGAAALRNPVIRRVVAMRSATLPYPQGHTTRVVGNIDQMLFTYPGAIGIKTGFTSEALNVVVGAATRGARSVIGVVMGESAASAWPDAASVLNYGFALEAAGSAPASVVTVPRGVLEATAVSPPVPVARRVAATQRSLAQRGAAVSAAPSAPHTAGVWRWWFSLPLAAAGLLAWCAAVAARRRARRRRRRSYRSPVHRPGLAEGRMAAVRSSPPARRAPRAAERWP